MNREKSCGAVVFTRFGGEIRFLIVQEASGAYSFPKGHVEGDETDEYDLSEKPGTHKQVVYFLSEFVNEPLVPRQGEIRKILLLPYAEALRLFQHEGTRRVLAAAQAFLSGQ